MITETKKPILPRRCTPQELVQVGVVLIDENDIRLACMSCGRKWSPLLRKDGRLPKGYWMCPEGCNTLK